MKKKKHILKKSVDKSPQMCENTSCTSVNRDRSKNMLRYSTIREGVQENALVQFPSVENDGCSVFESRALPYRNIEDCRKLMIETHQRNFKEMCEKYFKE